MSKRKKRKKKQTGSAPPSSADPSSLIEELLSIRPGLEAPDAGPNWGLVHKHLLKLGVDPARIPPIVVGRDLEALDREIRIARGMEDPIPEPSTNPADLSDEPDDPDESIPPETLRKAMKAFRRRVKLIKLDHESRLGVGPMSSGRSADFESIIPPHEFPVSVWRALAAEGRLEATGRGFYKLPDE